MQEEKLEGKIIKRKWKILKKIGEGNHSSIYICLDLGSKLYFAIKCEKY